MILGKAAPVALECLPKGVAGTIVISKSWVGVEVGWGWERGEAEQYNWCLWGFGQSTKNVCYNYTMY